MSAISLDVVIVADLRFPGGTSSAIAEEIRANIKAGYRTGVIQLKGPLLTFPHPVNPRIRALLDNELVQILDPDQPLEARLLCAHHPTNFEKRTLSALKVRSERRILVVHHPPYDGLGKPNYDTAAILVNAEQVLGGPVELAPVGPLVRTQFDCLDEPPNMLGYDWYNLIDTKVWRRTSFGMRGSRIRTGRHSRPDAMKWPDTRDEILAAYPDDPAFDVQVLGGGAFLKEILGGYPANWRVRPFGAIPPAEFLRGIDLFVYFHSYRLVEAFGIAILEALASGAVPILPSQFRPLFRDAALYCEIDAVKHTALEIREDRAAYRQLVRAGQSLLEERFSHATHARRLQDTIGAPRTVRRMKRSRLAVKRVMFLTTNGVGLGHLSRCLAVARQCSTAVQPVIVTMAQAVHVIRDMGFMADYIPHHTNFGRRYDRWNEFLKDEICERLSIFDIKVVVFDGNVPFQGLLDAIAANPGLFFLWTRRAFWRAGEGENHLRRERHFYAVLEPLDIASAYDVGLTSSYSSRTRRVGPITLVGKEEMLSRDEARAQLQLDAERPAALLQLGVGNNYDYGEIRRILLEKLLAHPGLQVFEPQPVISNNARERTDGVLTAPVYPVARYLKAFDFAVSACGYNSFHELLLAAVPTVFVPNENPMMDEQLARARYAENHGMGICLRTSDIYGARPSIDRMLDPSQRKRMSAKSRKLSFPNGAAQAARLIEELAYTMRTDIDKA